MTAEPSFERDVRSLSQETDRTSMLSPGAFTA
jgi:hypothetical protein